jgi:hypothetical protein
MFDVHSLIHDKTKKLARVTAWQDMGAYGWYRTLFLHNNNRSELESTSSTTTLRVLQYVYVLMV